MLAVAPPPRVALVPNAIAFRDPQHGLMGTGWQACENGRFGCKRQGTVSITSDGGRTWRVVLRTPRPVVDVGYAGALLATATYDDGQTVGTVDGGRRWTRLRPSPPGTTRVCPAEYARAFVSALWLLCTGQAGAGSSSKAVYELDPRTGKRQGLVAYTPFPTGTGSGGISAYGYPEGMSMSYDGFGVIWESRGTLYVTRDGGRHWVGLPRVAQPEVDFGMSGWALPHGVAFVLLATGGSERRRLLETTDAGRTWLAVHTWP